MNRREWNCSDHPEWLALELLQRLKIRPRQYTVAKQLLQNLGGAGLTEEERGAVLQVRLSPSTPKQSRFATPWLICSLNASASLVMLQSFLPLWFAILTKR
jgi:hypothetical protein